MDWLGEMLGQGKCSQWNIYRGRLAGGAFGGGL